MKKLSAFFLAICLVLPFGIALDAAPCLAAVGDNLISNSGFDGGSLQGWVTRTADRPYVGTLQEENGNYYAYIAERYDAYLEWYDEPIVPGADYELRFKARWEGFVTTQGISYKFQNNVQDVHGKAPTTIGDQTEWVEYTIPYRAPFDSTKVDLRLRHFTKGTVYYDDVRLTQVSEPNYLQIIYADVINYTDETEGIAELRLNTNAGYTPTENGYITLEIEDAEGSVLWSGERVPVKGNDTVETTFPTSVLQYTEGETTQYSLVARLYDEGIDTETSATERRNLYKYPRPSTLDKDGNTQIRENGEWKPFNPVMAYHVDIYDRTNPKSSKDIDKMHEIGVNVIQSMYEVASSIKYNLDEAEKYGFKMLVALYPNMITAGHPENLANTEATVKLVKDHPALLGYILMDEPYAYFDNPGKYFEAAYTLIRKYDTEHIITMMHDKVAWNEDAAQYVDVLLTDPYIRESGNPGSHVAEKTAEAVEDAKGKPIWPMVQVYPENGKTPTADEIRSTALQTLFSGAKGTGYFPIYGYSRETVDGVAYRRSLHEIPEVWNPMVERKNEINTVMNIFTRADRAKHPEISDVTNENTGVREISWYDGEDRYMAFLNTKGRGLRAGETSDAYNAASKAFTSMARVSLPNVAVETTIGPAENVSYQDGVLTINLEYCGVYVLKIEDENVENSLGFNGQFLDNDGNEKADNWTGTHTAVFPATPPYAGYAGGSIEIPGGKNYIVRHEDKIAVSSGDAYILSGYFKGAAKLYCEFTNADGAWGANQTQLGNAADWQFFSVQITVPSDKGFTDLQIGVRNESTALVSFADLVLRKHTNLVPSLSAWYVDSAYQSAGGTVQAAEGYNGESAIRLDFSKGAAWGRTHVIYPTFTSGKAYKVTLAYKTEDTECVPVLRLANMYGSSLNTDITFEQATHKNAWCTQTFSFVAPDANYGLKFELKKGAYTPEKTTYVTISDILIEEDKNEVIFPKASTFKSGTTVKVNYHFAESQSTLSENAERMIAVAVYKKEEGKTTLLTTKIIRTPSWDVPTQTSSLRKPFDFEISLALPTLSEGEYEIKVMTRDESLIRPFGTVYASGYEW